MAPSGLISGYCVCSEISKPILNKNMQKIVKHLTLCFLVWMCFRVRRFFRKRWILIHTDPRHPNTCWELIWTPIIYLKHLLWKHMDETPSLEAYGCLVNSCQGRKNIQSLFLLLHIVLFLFEQRSNQSCTNDSSVVYLSKRDGKTTVYYKYNSNEHCYNGSATLSVRKISHDASMGLVYWTCNLPYKSTIHVGKYVPMRIDPIHINQPYKSHGSVMGTSTLPLGFRLPRCGFHHGAMGKESCAGWG